MSRRVQGWRKLAGASWARPLDPQFYGEMDVDATPMLGYIERARAATGVHVTLTHLVGRAVAHGLVEVPQLRVRLAGGREHQRETVDVFFIVASEAGQELTGIKVCQADQKSAVELAREVNQRVEAIQAGHDPELGRGKAMMTVLPLWLLRPALRLGAWLSSDLNLDLPWLGVARQQFGGAMISSIGGMRVSRAFSPLAHYYRVPVLLLVGTAEPRPVVAGGEVVVRPVLTLSATFDHRYTDGFQAARFAHAVAGYFEDPAAFEPPW